MELFKLWSGGEARDKEEIFPEFSETAARRGDGSCEGLRSKWETIGSVVVKFGGIRKRLRCWVDQAGWDGGIKSRLADDNPYRMKAPKSGGTRTVPGKRDCAPYCRLNCKGGARPPVPPMLVLNEVRRAVHRRGNLQDTDDRTVSTP
jgi:hypothetical protein